MKINWKVYFPSCERTLTWATVISAALNDVIWTPFIHVAIPSENHKQNNDD